MAYASDESGRWEVYVGEFPGGGVRRQISAGGGVEPRWRPDGKELFYVSPDGTMMAVSMQFNEHSVLPAMPRPLFTARFVDEHEDSLTGRGKKLRIRAR
jgi:Tol biopolymer transport system component